MPLAINFQVRAAVAALVLVPAFLLGGHISRADTGTLGQHDIALSSGAEVSGTVLTVAGTPATGVVLLARTPGTPAPVTAMVDDKGNFTLGPLSPNVRVSIFTLPGDGWELAAPISFIAPPAGRELSSLQVVVRKPVFALVTGKVVDPKGQPLAGVNVNLFLREKNGSVEQQAVSTDATGTFDFEHAHDITEAQIYSLNLDGFAPQNIGTIAPILNPTDPDGPNESVLDATDPNVASVRTNLIFSQSVMQPLTGSYSGQVVDQNGHPISGALVAFAPLTSGSKAAFPIPFSQTGADGHFTVNNMPSDGLTVLAAYQGQFADEPLKNGANAQIQLRSTAASSPEAKNAFIKSFQPRDFDSLLPYWDFLGADKMRSLALLFDGDARLVPGGTNIEEGIAADDQNGCAFGRWMELLAENDPKSAAQTGPALLAKYDPAGKLYAARAAVAGACAKYGGPAGVAWADAWVDSFKNLPPFPDPGIYIDGDTDSVNPLFRVAGVANALGRADAGKLTQAALAAATLTGPSSELEFAKYWGKSLAAGGVPAMHLLDGQLPAPARLKAWSGAMELLAQQDSTASEAVWTELNTLQSDPDVQAWDKRPELDRNWDNLGIVMRDARMALQTAEAQTGSTDQLTAFSAGKNRRGARLLALLATVALRNHDQATARTATSDAMDDSDWQGWRSYAAALAASFDPTLGEQLFNRIRTDLTNNPTAQDLQDGDLVNYAYYHGFQDQAESHLLLEFAWRYLDTSSKDSGDWERGQYDNSRFQTAASLFPLDENVALLELGEPQETIDAKKAARARVLTMMFSDRATWSLIPPG